MAHRRWNWLHWPSLRDSQRWSLLRSGISSDISAYFLRTLPLAAKSFLPSRTAPASPASTRREGQAGRQVEIHPVGRVAPQNLTIVLLKLFLSVGEPCLTASGARRHDLDRVRAARRDGFCRRFLVLTRRSRTHRTVCAITPWSSVPSVQPVPAVPRFRGRRSCGIEFGGLRRQSHGRQDFWMVSSVSIRAMRRRGLLQRGAHRVYRERPA